MACSCRTNTTVGAGGPRNPWNTLYESEVGSKGFLSDVEKGLARPTVETLNAIAERLEVALLDLVTSPDEDDRQRLVDQTRRLSRGTIRKLLKETAPARKE